MMVPAIIPSQGMEKGAEAILPAALPGMLELVPAHGSFSRPSQQPASRRGRPSPLPRLPLPLGGGPPCHSVPPGLCQPSEASCIWIPSSRDLT